MYRVMSEKTKLKSHCVAARSKMLSRKSVPHPVLRSMYGVVSENTKLKTTDADAGLAGAGGERRWCASFSFVREGSASAESGSDVFTVD